MENKNEWTLGERSEWMIGGVVEEEEDDRIHVTGGTDGSEEKIQLASFSDEIKLNSFFNCFIRW